MVTLSLSLTICALAYASGTDEVAPTRLIFFGILPAIALSIVIWIVRLIAVGRLDPAFDLDLAGRWRLIFLWLITAHLAVFGAIFWAIILLVAAIMFDNVATPLKAMLSLMFLFVLTGGLKNSFMEVAILYSTRTGKARSSDI